MLVALYGATRFAIGQSTERVSVDSAEVEGNDSSRVSSISADGLYVAFQSDATNLVGGDTNNSKDIFVRDRQNGTTERVSVDSAGAQGNGGSRDPSISADGRYVAFHSFANNLVSGDTNNADDIFVRDRQLGTTERVSVDSAGAEGNAASVYPSVSDDGRYVAFFSYASNLVGGDTNTSRDVFVRNRQSGTTERVSVDSAGAEGNGDSRYPSISVDGRFVAFWSFASNLVSGDTNLSPDVFVRDRQSGTTERVSIDSAGTQGNLPSYDPSICADGRYVAFMSEAFNLVSGDANRSSDVFVRDRQSGTTELVSSSSAGAQGDWDSLDPSISADGRYVAFDSNASNLVIGDTNPWQDVFLRDRQLGTTERVSVDSAGVEGDSPSYDPSISADGRYVAFHSSASNFVNGDTNGWSDVFVRDRNSVDGTKYCAALSNSTGSPADISARGSAHAGAGYLVLESSPVPNQPGIFFHGLNQTQVPFGNGFLCTTGGIVRGAVTMATGNVATYLYDNSDAQHSLQAYAGIARHFQHWFRDSMGSGALFNTSNAISILVQP